MLSALVSDEAFDQRYQFRNIARLRRLESDIGFLRLPGGGPWLAQRSVRAIDGAAVAGAAAALDAMLTLSGDDRFVRARAIAEGNARHNLGYARTMNVPKSTRRGPIPRRTASAWTFATMPRWCPTGLEERYVADGEGRGTAVYRSYRRFQTSGRLVPPQH